MLDYCGNHRAEIGAVVVWAVSRFARNMMDHLTVRERLRKNDIQLLSCTQELDDSTAAGRLHENFLSLQAQYDNDQRSERTIAGMKTAMGSGKWCHKAPIGYLNADSPGGLSQDPKSAGLVLTVFELYAAGKHSKKAVLEAVTEQGLRTKEGKLLSPQTLDKMLRNPLYAGWITSAWGIIQEGAFDPIISVELFERAQDRLTGNVAARRTRSRENPEFPLRVFLRCAHCGRGLTGSFSTGRRGKRYPYYCCPKPGCRAVKFGRDKLHHDFYQVLYSFLPEDRFMPLFHEVVRDVWRQRNTAQTELAARLAKTIASLEARDQKVIDLFVDGQFDKATYEDQRERVGTALNKARSQQSEALMPIEQIESLLEFAEWMLVRAAGIWDSASLPNKLRIQQVLFPDGLTVSREGIGTPIRPLFFVQFQDIPTDESGLASPGGFEPTGFETWPDVAVLSLLFSDLAVRQMLHRRRYEAPTWSPRGRQLLQRAKVAAIDLRVGLLRNRRRSLTTNRPVEPDSAQKPCSYPERPSAPVVLARTPRESRSRLAVRY